MNAKTLALTLFGLLLAVLPAAAVNPPDYKLWGDLLSKYYDPAKGMDYKALKANDKKTLDELRRQMAQVDVVTLPKNDQLAYWINLYNISTVNVVVENYPVKSIRDISTDFIAHLNVFKKDYVLTRKGPMSLNDVENDKIRNHFMDSRAARRSAPSLTWGRGSRSSSTTRRGRSSTAPTASAWKKAAGSSSCIPPRSWTGSRTTSRSGAAAGCISFPRSCPRTSASRSRRPATRLISNSMTTTGA
jgi:hypothetical protein